MGVFVKICGICSEEDAGRVSALGPDALGFVHWAGSRRYVAPMDVGRWATPAGIRRVGVFVNPSAIELVQAARAARLDVVQLHRVPGAWAIDRTLLGGVEAWCALDPAGPGLAEPAFPFDRFLLDTYDPQTVGGTGRLCDWGTARDLVRSLRAPVLLAGGLAPGNVAEAIAAVRPWGVDTSSGVEAGPGKKDIAKVAAFIAACRGA